MLPWLFTARALENPVLSKVDAPLAGKGAVASNKMTPVERRASFSLATIFSLRMLGLFLILPVFALEALSLIHI